MKLRYYFLLTLFLISLDQLTKLLIYQNIQYGKFIPINSFLTLYHTHNYGAAFSFLAQQSGWQKYLLITISTIVSIAIIIWMTKIQTNNIIKLSALSMLLSGAVGNLIDRLIFGFVIDFIYLHYNKFSWPVFNFADILISCSVILLIINYKKNE